MFRALSNVFTVCGGLWQYSRVTQAILPPPPPPYEPPPTPRPPKAKMNALAVVALVTGVVALVPLAAIFGIIALRQVAQRGERGRDLAVTGLAIAGVWLVIIAVTVTQKTTPKAERDEAGAVAQNGRLTVFDLKKGDCFNNVPAEDKNVMVVDAVACAQPHDAEVLDKVEMPKRDAYPGREAASAEIEKLCNDLVGDRLANSDIREEIGLYILYPTAESWAQGDRAGGCIAVGDAKLTRPVG
jgi:hypothetical protein